MGGSRLIGAIIGILAAIACVTSFWIGLGIGNKEQEETVNDTPSIERFIEMPELPNDGSVYKLVIYDGHPEVEVVTKHEYINQVSENTMVITNKSLDEVNQEIYDSMDYIEVN